MTINKKRIQLNAIEMSTIEQALKNLSHHMRLYKTASESQIKEVERLAKLFLDAASASVTIDKI